jgi:hypothetical protein
MTKLRYEIDANQYVLRVYDESSPDNYIASAIVRVYGDRGWVSSISSPRLFEALPEYFNQVMEKLKIVTMEGYMSKAMARAVRMSSRTWAKFEITHYGQCAGREMPWVKLSKLENEGSKDV